MFKLLKFDETNFSEIYFRLLSKIILKTPAIILICKRYLKQKTLILLTFPYASCRVFDFVTEFWSFGKEFELIKQNYSDIA